MKFFIIMRRKVAGQDRRENCKIFMKLWMIVSWWILALPVICLRGREGRYGNGWTGELQMSSGETCFLIQNW